MVHQPFIDLEAMKNSLCCLALVTAFFDLFDDLCNESFQVVGVARGDDALVANDLLVLPNPAGILHVGFDRAVRRHFTAANRIGFTRLSLPQLKVLQEVITLIVFVPIAMRLFHVRFRTDFIWAGLCLVGAVFFAFRGGLGSCSVEMH